MERQFYLELAARGLRMPIGAHLVLHDQSDPEAVLMDGQRLGQVIEETARRYHTPLAISLMDLTIEKEALLEMLDVPPKEIPTFHFEECPPDDAIDQVARRMATYHGARVDASVAAIRHVANQSDLMPIGMVIGPFSLMVKLVSDPIAAVYQAGRGRTAADVPKLAIIERALDLGTRVIEWSIRAQVEAGARGMVVCEPAASTAYISPHQMKAENNVFDRYVMSYNHRLKRVLDELGADLVFHCCGEITTDILRRFVELDPPILSLGSSRNLWEDAEIVPKTTVLYGNLPSKKFFSDTGITTEEVQRQSRDLIQRMRAAKHPFILGTECDVLSVPGCQDVIKSKVQAFIDAPVE